MSKIHLITVADLKDPNIGVSCRVDLQAVQELMREAAAQAGMTIDVKEVSGDAFSADAITQAVRNVAPDQNDTVIFYYSGHGARGESKPDAWPVISLPSLIPPYDSFDLGWVYQTLNKKKLRMLLMFVDCCQQLLPDDLLNDTSPGAVRGLIDIHSASNYRLLFQTFEGEVLLMSCKPGQLSGCTPQRGGFFTAIFLEALRKFARSPRAATWETVAKEGSTPPDEDQEPIWKVIRATQLDAGQAPGMEPFPGHWTLGQASETVNGVEAMAFRSLRRAARRCHDCGASLRAEARFCQQCGAPVGTQDIAAAAAPPARSSVPQPPESRTAAMLHAADQNPVPERAQRKMDKILERVENLSDLEVSVSRLENVLQRSEDTFDRAQKKAEAQLDKLKDRLKDL
jgi:hypothetical protein